MVEITNLCKGDGLNKSAIFLKYEIDFR